MTFSTHYKRKTMDQESVNLVNSYMKRLEEIEGAYNFQLLLDEFREKASKDEIAIWFVFKNIIQDAIKDSSIWDEKPNLIIGVFYILIDLGNEKAFALFKWYVQNLHEDINNGVLELLASLIATFKFVTFKEFLVYAKAENKARSALGYLVLFNLFLEKKLKPDDQRSLYEFSKKYTNDRYYFGNIPDMIHSKFKSDDTVDQEAEKIIIES